jgi:imidazoleglycerol-phosphate dehydratase
MKGGHNMRNAQISRRTTETLINLRLELDGTGKYEISSGSGFFDHMLELFTRHGGFDLTLSCDGDVKVDFHHSAEDIGIALGDGFKQALGDKAGITRYGSFLLPMDEALVQVALDVSGRSHLSCGLDIPAGRVGEFDTELVEEFLLGLCRGMGLTLHMRQLAGTNSHHIIEAGFKALGRALRQAVALDPYEAGRVPSTKGIL